MVDIRNRANGQGVLIDMTQSEKAKVFSGSARKAWVLGLFLALFPGQAHAEGLGDWASGLLNSASNAVTGIISGVISGVSSAVAGLITAAGSFLNSAISSIINWIFGSTGCGTVIESGTGTIGDVICNVIESSSNLPGFISAIAYMMGMIMAVTALIKLKDHVESPSHNPLSASLKRFVAGGALFMLPTITEATETLLTGQGAVAGTDTGVSGSAVASYGLDAMMVALIVDIYEPLSDLLGAFGYLAGLVLVVIGISRLLKTAQDGPNGPTGLGTIMTFVVAGVLFTLDDIMTAFTGSLFGSPDITTYAILATPTNDMVIDEHILAVISSVLLFMMLVGWISFIRGFFILRDVAEGKQASLMAAVTHIFGGALAVNLGPLMNAVQATFGLSYLGVIFD